MQRFNRFAGISIFAIMGLALLLIISSPAQALMIDMSLDDLAPGADAILIGTVVETTSGWNSTHTMICTSVTLSVEECLKGNIAAGTDVVISVPGGQVGEITQTISDMPGFYVGERTLVFLNKLPAEKINQVAALQKGVAADVYQVYGCYQGKFSVDNGMVGGMKVDDFKGQISGIMAGTPLGSQPAAEKTVVNVRELSGNTTGASDLSGAAVLATISPSIASAGTDSVVTITGSGFGATKGSSSVQFFYLTSGSNYYIAQDAVISWSNTQIKCTVPAHYAWSYPASAGSGPVYVVTYPGGTETWSNPLSFTVTFSNGKVKWSGSSPVVGYKINAAAATRTAVNAAATTWNNAGTPFRFSYTGTTTATEMTTNGINEILWNHNPPSGVLAWASTSSSGANITETDIEYNSDYSWSTAATCPAGWFDVESIGLHELGHWLMLRDLYGNRSGYPSDTRKVMYGFSSPGATKRAPTMQDIAGIRYLYGTCGPVTGNWNGTGGTKIGTYVKGIWYLDYNGTGIWNGTAGGDKQYTFGNASQTPVTGNWNGTGGTTKIGTYCKGIWYLDLNGNGAWNGTAGGDRQYAFGDSSQTPVTGNWNGTGGTTKIGTYYNGTWYLDYNGNGVWNGGATDKQYTFGDASQMPVTGDWNNDGKTEIGTYKAGTWYLDFNGNGAWNGTAGGDRQYAFGNASQTPVTGNWNGTLGTEIGTFLNGKWYLDYNANGAWNGNGTGPTNDRQYTFGN